MNTKTNILIVNSAEPGIRDFTEPLEKIVQEQGLNPATIEYKNCIGFDFSTVDGAILSGSRQGDDIIEHHLPYFKWIPNFRKPVLGICAGHHISGFMNGSKILRSEEPESGDFFVTLLRKDRLFDGLPERFKVKQMHNDSITLPENFELLASSETCNNQLMKHKTKPWYSCQFHPEFYNHELIKNFLKICIK
jgi:GMP synthase (glutamine-hydrolysing)